MPRQTIQGKALPSQLKKIARFVKLMDSEFTIPGTTITFGLDPIIGLVPGLGDLADFSISALLLIAMIRNGAEGKAVAKMILNITLDAIVGIIPFFGRIFDVFYKANQRNLVLASEHFVEGKHRGSAASVIVPVVIILFVMFAGMGILAAYILKWLWMFLHHTA